jgi:hypothetical protein
MSKLTIERGLNGVAFVKVGNKPALSISSYGNRTVAMQILDLMVTAPELLETLTGLTDAAQRIVDAVGSGEPLDVAALQHWIDAARAHGAGQHS